MSSLIRPPTAADTIAATLARDNTAPLKAHIATQASLPPPPRPRVAWQTITLQGAIVAMAAALLGWLAYNAASNLSARNLASGFGFLEDAAGFAISEGLVPYEAGDHYLRAFAAGMANTVRVAVPAILMALLISLAAGTAQLSRHALVRGVARTYVDLVRNVPLLVQVLLWYFTLTTLLPAPDAPSQLGDVYLSKAGLGFPLPLGLPALLAGLVLASLVLPVLALRRARHRPWKLGATALVLALGWAFLPGVWEAPQRNAFGVAGGGALSPEWLSLVLALVIFAGAYGGETVRAGLLAVGKGQWEAGHALGLTHGQTLRRVILPQALRVIIPPYTSLMMNTVKNSSLGVAIGYPEIVSVGTTTINQNGQAIECIALIAAVYFTLNLAIALGMGALNRRVQLRER